MSAANTGEQTAAAAEGRVGADPPPRQGLLGIIRRRCDQVVSIRQISLYNRNAPFSGERWLLIGVVGRNDLFRFSQSVTNLVSFAILLTLGFGLGCAFFVSIGLAQPVAQLSKELAVHRSGIRPSRSSPAPASGSWTGWPTPS